ncbi:MAG: GntR family transcriptional regulator [Blautia sp.]|nr:GntR family transcriptional regulator [Blautia sp.]
MEFNPALPIYLQVMTAIKRDIVTGDLSPGEKLPSVRDMALRYTINPNTAGRVYRELESEGVCFTRRGMGTFVTEDEDKIEQMKEEMVQELAVQFLEGMKLIGISGEEAVEWIRKLSQQYCSETEQNANGKE